MPYARTRSRRRAAIKRTRGKSLMYRKRRKYMYKRRKVSPMFKSLIPNWPMKTKMAFTYNQSQIVTTSSSSNTASLLIYRLNGLWDPEFALGGNNVFGFDQFMGTLYDKYYCYQTLITVTFTTANAGATVCGLHIANDSATTTTSPEILMNQPTQPYRMITNASTPITISRMVKHRQFYPLTDIGNLTGTSSTDPVNSVFGKVWVADAAYKTTPSTYGVACTVRMKFYCVLGRKDIVPAST